MSYSNTNEHLYNDIALWEKTDGRDLFLEMPLAVKDSPSVLDFGYGFGENLFALSNAYPNGKIYGIDCSPACQKEVGDKIAERGLKYHLNQQRSSQPAGFSRRFSGFSFVV